MIMGTSKSKYQKSIMKIWSKQKTRNIFINQKSYKDLVIYFARYHRDKSITVLNLYYDELIGKIEEKEYGWWLYTK